MKNTQRGFIVPLLLVIIAVLLVGGGTYLYTQKKQVTPPATANLPTETQTTKTSDSQPITLTTIDICSPVVKDASTLFFTDNNNKVWTVNYSNATFTRIGTLNKVVSTALQDWIKTLYRVGQPKAEICGAPGKITVTGTLSGTTVYASHIELVGQG